MQIKVLDIRKTKFSDSIVLAFVNIQIDNLIIKGCRIINGKNGLFLSYPRERGKDDKWYDIVIPTEASTKIEIESYVLAEYKKIQQLESSNLLDTLPPLE